MNKDSIFPFNEISLRNLTDSKKIQVYFDRVTLLNKLIRNDGFLKIAYHSSVLREKSINGKSFLDHIDDSGLAPDNRGSLLSTIQETPFLDELQQNKLDAELYYDNANAVGGAYAYHLKHAIFSIPSNAEWNKYNVIMDKRELDSKGDFLISSVTVYNLGSIESEDYEGSWVSELIGNQRITSTEVLMDLIEKECPHIVLSDIAVDYITKLGNVLGTINRIFDQFTVLEKYCVNHWHDGDLIRSHISDCGLILKDESSSTMKKYGKERQFKNHLNKTTTYRFHYNVTEGDRAYIGGINDEKKIFISYMGKHLKTVKHA